MKKMVVNNICHVCKYRNQCGIGIECPVNEYGQEYVVKDELKNKIIFKENKSKHK